MFNKLNIIVGILIMVVGVVVSAKAALAGGCCYLNYNTSLGVANQSPAQVTTAFTDPQDSFTDDTKSKLKPVTNQKVSIQIMQPKSGQACFMIQDETDANGYIKAECVSPTAGEMKVTFTLSGNPGGINEIIKTVPLKLQFTGGQAEEQEVSTAPTSRPMPTERPQSPSPTTVMVKTDDKFIDVTADQEMQDRVNQLEQEVAKQKQEVSGLRALVNQLLTAIEKIFHWGS